MKYIRILVLALTFCLLFAGCKNDVPDIELPDDFVEEPTEAPFSRGGVTFDLPEDFSDYSDLPLGERYEFLYASSFVGVYGLKDIAGGLDEEISTFDAFAATLAENRGAEATKKDNYWIYSYEDLEQNEPQMVVCAIYEVGDCFWSIYSYCPSELFAEYSDAMWQYITTAVFE